MIDNNKKRIQELDTAVKDGRCVILPCKVGDTVYVVEQCGWKGVYIGHVVYVLFSVNKKGEQKLNIRITCLDSTESSNYFTDDYKADDFGKTVFLTREEAEAALEKEENG